jgi:hypothetical protein
MPLLERRGTPRRSDSSLSGSSSPSFFERFYFTALGYLFVGLGLADMVLSALVGHWLGVAMGFSLFKIGLTALSMVHVAKQSKRLPWLLEKLVLWGSGIVKNLFTVFRLPLYAFGAFVALCVTVRVWSGDRLFRIAGMPVDCSVAPSPVHGCHRVAAMIVPVPVPDSTTPAENVQRRMVRGTSTTEASTAPRARKAPPERKNNKESGSAGEVFEIVSSRDECLSVAGVAKLVEEWADGDAAFSRRLKRTVDHDGSITAHWRVLSTLFGFADDLVVRVAAAGKAIDVEAQSQLRLGVGDFGVNKRRTMRLVKALEQVCSDRLENS